MTQKNSLDAAIERHISQGRLITPDEVLIISAARAHAASLREPLGNEGWRPIADAPMDTWIMVYDTDHCEIVRWIPQRRDEGIKSPRLWVDGVTIRSWIKPTHFQPLPSPPSTKERE